MDTRSFRKIGFEAVNGFKKNGLMRKTVANLVTVFFIVTGIPVPTSFAGTNALLGSAASNNTRTITLVEANARSVAPSTTVPSGVAIKTSSPLSRTSATVTAYDPSQNTVLPNQPSVGSGVGSTDGVVSGTLQVQQSSSKNIQAQYSNLDASDYAYVYLSRGGMTMDLSTGITVGVNGALGSQLKMQLKDASGHVATFLLTLQGTMNSYTILGSYLQGLDATRITEVTFVVEPSRMGASGSFAIETAGLAYAPMIPSDPTLHASDVTTLAEVHHVYSIADMNGATASLAQQSASLYTLSYSMSQPGNWAVGLTAFDDYGSPGVVETRDLSLMNRLVMGLRLASGYGDVKIEFEDVNRNKAIVYLDAVGTSEKFYGISMDLLRAEFSQFDLQHVLNINVVVEKNNVSQPTGQLQVRLGGHPYTPIVSGTFYDQSQITSLPNQPILNSGIGWNEPRVPASTIQVVQTSSSEFTFDYTMPDEGDYVFSYFGAGYFDGMGGWIGMPMNLPSNVVLAVNGPAGKKLKVEILDVNGIRKICYLALESSYRNYTLDLLGLGVNPQEVAQIVFTAERSQMGSAGRVTVGVNGLLYIPVIPPSPILTPADVTVLSNVRHLISIANPPAIASVTPQSSSLYNLDYALPQEGDWAVGLSSFDDFGTEVRETQDLSTLQNFVIGLRLASGSGRIKLEFEDVNRVKSFVYLSGVNTTEQFYAIPLDVLLAGNPRLDLSQIANVNVVVEKNSVSESSGQLQVRLGGHSFAPEVPEGWTRTSYDPALAYRGDNTNGVEVMNLLTRQITTVPTSQDLTWSTGYRRGIRYVITPGGVLKELYYFNSRSNTLVGVYDPAESAWFGNSVYVAAFQNQPGDLSVSPDGAYAVVAHQVNLITTLALSGTPTNSRVFLPAADGAGTPWVGTMTFTGPRMALVTVEDGSSRQFDLEIKADGSTVLLPHVPQGWTRAASNGNFAYKITQYQNEVGMGRAKLEVMDLVKGQTYLVKDVLAIRGGYSINGADVSADGKYVVALLRSFYGPEEAFVYFFESARAPITSYLGYVMTNSIELKENEVWIRTRDYDFVIDLNTGATLKLIAIDDIAWKRTPSNIAYAFQYQTRETEDVLVLQDLRTGVFTELRAGAYPVRLSGTVTDVSPTGLAVLFSSVNGVKNTVHLQSLADPSKTLAMEGELQSLAYEQEGRIAVLALMTEGGSRVVRIDLTTLQYEVPAGWTQAASNPNFAYKLKFVTDPDTFNYFQLEVVELLSGKNVAVRKAVNRPGGEDFTGFVDVAPDGKYVVYEVAYARGSFPKTIEIFNMETQAVFSVPTGHATLIGVQFSATHIYVHTDAVEVDHVVRGMHIVDLTDGSQNFVPDVPSGWTRAASNVNYAFHVKDERVGSYTVNTLQLMDLRTGEMQDVAKTQPPVILTISRYDVSADGNAVIYEMNSYMHVQKISDPSVLWVGGGIPKTITISEHLVEFAYDDGTRISIDTQTFQRAVPEGWTRAASNVNYAFKIEKVGSYALLRLLDIEAGKSQILIKRLIGRSNANPISGVYDVSPDGTTVIYGTSSVMYVQKIASPLKKLTLSGVLKSVSFIGQVAEITKTNGTRQWVNISTLKVVPRPIPSGWTVVPSLPTRAYQTITGNRVRVMDLWTGTVSEKPTSQNYSGIRSGLYYVMTSMGLKEIYSVRVGRGMVLRSYDPVTKRWASY